MSRGINKVILVGNLGADPEIKYTAGGSAICRLSVATSEQWTDKQTGQKQERTEWSRVVVFGKLAEICGEYLRKGRQVYIEGSLRTSKYTGKDGVERYSTDIIAHEMQMLGSNDGGNSYQRQSRPPVPNCPQPDTPSRYPAKPSYNDPNRNQADDGFDDSDIPF